MNKHGLPRAIPEDVKLAVRQASGFGCVICGSTIVDYEHIRPEYSDAKVHDPTGITLLCPLCHAKKTRGWLAPETILEEMSHPFCRRTGFSFGALDPSFTPPIVHFAGNVLRNCPIPVMVERCPLFLVEAPPRTGEPYELSAAFFNSREELALLIRRNEWKAYADQWDVEASGGTITIRTGLRKIALQISFVPRRGVVVDRLDMAICGARLVGNDKELTIDYGAVRGMKASGSISDNNIVGLHLEDGGFAFGVHPEWMRAR